MKKRILITIFASLFYIIINAQQWQWAKDMGGAEGADIARDVYGNLYVLSSSGAYPFSYGTTTLGCGNSGTVAKHDNAGNIIWARGLNFSFGHVSLDKVGNVYVTGALVHSVTVCGGNNPDINLVTPYGTDVIVCKYNNNGDLLWAKTWDNNVSPDDRPSISRTDENGYTYIAGYSQKQSNPYADADVDHFIIKYDSLGNVLWSNTNNWNGSMMTAGLDIDGDGNIYTCGYFADTAYFNNISLTTTTHMSFYYAKYSSNGNAIWAKKDGTGYDKGNSLKLDKQGNLYITGEVSMGSVFSGATLSPWGIFVAKYDTSGNNIWVRNSAGGEGFSITADPAGNAFITGIFGGTATFYGSPPVTITSQKQGDMYVVKYDKYGNLKWAIAPTGPFGSANCGTAIETDNSNCRYITGYFNAQTVFGSFSLNAQGAPSHIFIAKLKDTINSIPTGYDKDLKKTDLFSIGPNPAKNDIKVNFTAETSSDGLYIKMLNVTGQALLNQYFPYRYNSFEYTFDCSKYVPGLYFVELLPINTLNNSTNRRYVKKIIVE